MYMGSRKNIVAGNWKMHTTYEEGRSLAAAVVNGLQPSDTVVVLAAPFIHLNGLHHLINDVNNLYLAAQNCHQEKQGAYTGEVSPAMLRSVGCDYVILGHSERREYFGETDELIAAKVNAALAHQLTPIYCCGEKLEVRDAGSHLELVAGQIKTGLFHLSAEDFSRVVIAYEPVWAIGTGRTASPEQAQEMHAYIRGLARAQYGDAVAEGLSILYGGSVKGANAAELFGQPDVDGGLVGGASLNAAEFVTIIEACNQNENNYRK
jgi:triosephosphate isomerase